MKIQDVMQTSILKVSEDTSIKEVTRIIFSTGISGVPVVKEGKLVGIITQEDILSHLYPSGKEPVEDFSQIEKNLVPLLDSPVGSIMKRDVMSVMPDTKLTVAQGIMLDHNFSRIPVIDSKGNLMGMVSQGDIFRQLVRSEVPKMEQEHYAMFVSENYDITVDWAKRFEYEFPSLFRVFNRHNVKKILDIGVWTGEYSIGLANEGLEIIGLDHNELMIKEANEKLAKASKKIKDNVTFFLTDFTNIPQVVKGPVDAIVSMGNSFPYIPRDLEETLKDAKKVLRSKDGVIVLQLLNMNRVLNTQRRLLSFSIKESQSKPGNQHLSVEFFDKGKGNELVHHVIIFDADGENWIYKGISSITIQNIDQEDVEKMLTKLGFKEISISGNKGDTPGDYGQMSLIKPFDPLTSDWMTVIAHT